MAARRSARASSALLHRLRPKRPRDDGESTKRSGETMTKIYGERHFKQQFGFSDDLPREEHPDDIGAGDDLGANGGAAQQGTNGNGAQGERTTNGDAGAAGEAAHNPQSKPGRLKPLTLSELFDLNI